MTSKNDQIKKLLTEAMNLFLTDEQPTQPTQPVKINITSSLEVKSHDEPERMTWYEAMKKFGPDGTDPDWRLPTKEELHQMYLQKDKIPNLTDNWYWSSTECTRYASWVDRFNCDYQCINFNDYTFQVRCVRR